MAAGTVVEPVGAVEIAYVPATGPVLQNGVTSRDLSMVDCDRLSLVATNRVTVKAMEALVVDPDDDG